MLYYYIMYDCWYSDVITIECAHSNKHKLRLLYVDVCKFIMELFSKSFFKQYFCEALLELAGVSIYVIHVWYN